MCKKYHEFVCCCDDDDLLKCCFYIFCEQYKFRKLLFLKSSLQDSQSFTQLKYLIALFYKIKVRLKSCFWSPRNKDHISSAIQSMPLHQCIFWVCPVCIPCINAKYVFQATRYSTFRTTTLRIKQFLANLLHKNVCDSQSLVRCLYHTILIFQFYT